MTLAERRAQRVRLLEAGAPVPVEARDPPVAGDLPPATLCGRCRRVQIRWLEAIPVEAEPTVLERDEYTLAVGETERRWVAAGHRAYLPHPCAWAPRPEREPVERPYHSPIERRRGEDFERWYREGR